MNGTPAVTKEEGGKQVCLLQTLLKCTRPCCLCLLLCFYGKEIDDWSQLSLTASSLTDLSLPYMTQQIHPSLQKLKAFLVLSLRVPEELCRAQ